MFLTGLIKFNVSGVPLLSNSNSSVLPWHWLSPSMCRLLPASPTPLCPKLSPHIATFALVILISVKITSSGELIGYTELIIKNMYILLFIDYYYFCCISFASETFYDTLLYAYISQMFLRLVVKYSPTHHQWAPVVTGLTGLTRCIHFLPFRVSVPLSFPGFPGIISETNSF